MIQRLKGLLLLGLGVFSMQAQAKLTINFIAADDERGYSETVKKVELAPFVDIVTIITDSAQYVIDTQSLNKQFQAGGIDRKADRALLMAFTIKAREMIEDGDEDEVTLQAEVLPFEGRRFGYARPIQILAAVGEGEHYGFKSLWDNVAADDSEGSED